MQDQYHLRRLNMTWYLFSLFLLPDGLCLVIINLHLALDLVRRTYTRKDGTFVDYHAEELVTQVEKEVSVLIDSDESPN